MEMYGTVMEVMEMLHWNNWNWKEVNMVKNPQNQYNTLTWVYILGGWSDC